MSSSAVTTSKRECEAVKLLRDRSVTRTVLKRDYTCFLCSMTVFRDPEFEGQDAIVVHVLPGKKIQFSHQVCGDMLCERADDLLKERVRVFEEKHCDRTAAQNALVQFLDREVVAYPCVLTERGDIMPVANASRPMRLEFECDVRLADAMAAHAHFLQHALHVSVLVRIHKRLALAADAAARRLAAEDWDALGFGWRAMVLSTTNDVFVAAVVDRRADIDPVVAAAVVEREEKTKILSAALELMREQYRADKQTVEAHIRGIVCHALQLKTPDIAVAVTYENDISGRLLMLNSHPMSVHSEETLVWVASKRGRALTPVLYDQDTTLRVAPFATSASAVRRDVEPMTVQSFPIVPR